MNKAILSAVALCVGSLSAAHAGAPRWFDNRKQMCQDIAKYQGFELDMSTKAEADEVSISGSVDTASGASVSGGLTFKVQKIGFSKEQDPGNAFCCHFTVGGKLLSVGRNQSGNDGCAKAGDALLLQHKGDGNIPMVPIQTFLRVDIDAGQGKRTITKLAEGKDFEAIKAKKIARCSESHPTNCWFKNKVEVDAKEGHAYVENMIMWLVGAGINRFDDTQTKKDFWHNYSKKDRKDVPTNIVQVVKGLRESVER